MTNYDRHNARNVALYANPRGGRATGTFIIDGVLVQAHALPPFSHYKCGSIRFPPGSFVRTEIVDDARRRLVVSDAVDRRRPTTAARRPARPIRSFTDAPARERDRRRATPAPRCATRSVRGAGRSAAARFRPLARS